MPPREARKCFGPRRAAAGGRLSESIATWTVVGVDPAANTITLVNPAGGPVRTHDVTTAVGRQQLPRVKRGDSLTEINSQLVVASITPRSRRFSIRLLLRPRPL